jgi:hypothetical protein
MRPEPDDKLEQSEQPGPAKKPYKMPLLCIIPPDEALRLLEEHGIKLEELIDRQHDQD